MPAWLVFVIVGAGLMVALSLLFVGRRHDSVTRDRTTNASIIEQQSHSMRNHGSGGGLF